MESLRGSAVSLSARSASCTFSSLQQIGSNQQFPVSRGTQLRVPGSLLGFGFAVFFSSESSSPLLQKYKPKQNLTHFENCLLSQVPLSLPSVHQLLITAAQHGEPSLKGKTKTRGNEAQGKKNPTKNPDCLSLPKTDVPEF